MFLHESVSKFYCFNYFNISFELTLFYNKNLECIESHLHSTLIILESFRLTCMNNKEFSSTDSFSISSFPHKT